MTDAEPYSIHGGGWRWFAFENDRYDPSEMILQVSVVPVAIYETMRKLMPFSTASAASLALSHAIVDFYRQQNGYPPLWTESKGKATT